MFIRLFIYLIPVLLGLVIPFLMNSARAISRIKSGSFPKSLIAFIPAFLVIIAISIIAGLLLLFNGSSASSAEPSGIGNALGLIVFLLALGVLVSALFILLISLGVSGNLSQLLVTLLILLMCGTVFYANPFIETYENVASVRQTIIAGTIKLNPILIIAGNFLRHDILLSPKMYNFSEIADYPHSYYSPWYYILCWYLGISILILVFCGIIRLKSLRA